MTDNHSSEVLIVDDNLRNLQVMGTILRDRGYRIALAKSGKEGIRMAQKTHPDLILLDIMMPEMDGFETCEKLKSNAHTQDIPVIFLSSKTETEDIVKGFEKGAVDYITKPAVKEEVVARVHTHLQIGLLNRQLIQSNLELKKKQNKLEEGLQSASVILRNLLPSRKDFPGFQIAWIYQPAETLGGDFFDLIPLGDGKYAFYILDVSGHGVPSSLMAVSVSQVLQPPSGVIVGDEGKKAQTIVSPDTVLSSLNRLFSFNRFLK